MLINCFTVTWKKNNNCVNIDTIFIEFGDGGPKYLQYEGGSNGITFLCCVDANINAMKIFKKYNYELGTVYQFEIDDEKYNNNYTIYPTYNSTCEKFILQRTNHFS